MNLILLSLVITLQSCSMYSKLTKRLHGKEVPQLIPPPCTFEFNGSEVPCDSWNENKTEFDGRVGFTNPDKLKREVNSMIRYPNHEVSSKNFQKKNPHERDIVEKGLRCSSYSGFRYDEKKHAFFIVEKMVERYVELALDDFLADIANDQDFGSKTIRTKTLSSYEESASFINPKGKQKSMLLKKVCREDRTDFLLGENRYKPYPLYYGIVIINRVDNEGAD